MKRYIIITGASAGIGYAAAKAFAAQGKNLILAARRMDKLEALRQEIAQENPQASIVLRQVDLSRTEQCTAFYESLKAYEIEALINNAGMGIYGAVAQQAPERFMEMISVNVSALTMLSALFVKQYRDTPGTQLINIASAGGYQVVQNAVTYCGTKFYVTAFTEGLAKELEAGGAQMKAKVFAPFLTETEFAKVASGEPDFEYAARYREYHTAAEVADMLLALYHSDKMTGLVSREDFSFSLGQEQLPHAKPAK